MALFDVHKLLNSSV